MKRCFVVAKDAAHVLTEPTFPPQERLYAKDESEMLSYEPFRMETLAKTMVSVPTSTKPTALLVAFNDTW